jgi:CTP:molybdopterin cytidylyltransferase MocA
MNAVGILLAAGRGRRFDPGPRNKLLQPLRRRRAGRGGQRPQSTFRSSRV